MKRFSFLLFVSFLFSMVSVSAQNDQQMKIDNLRYFLSSVKDNIASMRYYADSANVIEMIDNLELAANNLELELDKIVIEPEPEEVMVEEVDTVMEVHEDYTWGNEPETQVVQDESGLGLSKYMPFKNKSNTNFTIQFGINNFIDLGKASDFVPELNTAKSWYWDFALTRRARLGSPTSKVAINYGISFLKNRFTLAQNYELLSEGVFTNLGTHSPVKLNVGYLNIPLGFSFSLSKKVNLNIGGYAGYRIHTVQKVSYDFGEETVHSKKYAGYNLNNWVYGANASLDIGGFDLIFRYNISDLFKENDNYKFNTFMIGTSVSLF